MFIRLQNIYILFFLIFLQSCSGGKVGNFLESSFKNIEQNQILENNNINNDQKKSLVDTKRSNKNNIILKNKEEINNPSNVNNSFKSNVKEQNKKSIDLSSDIEVTQIKRKEIVKKDFKNLVNIKNKQYKPQEYKIILILKNVDPTAPAEEFSNVLRNSKINFEIEKIERHYNSDDKK